MDVRLLTPQVRFREHLTRLLRDGGRGSKSGLAHYCHKSHAWVSNLLNARSKKPEMAIDDLDLIAGFFRISVGELLGETNLGNLSGDEQRMIYAFRALPLPTQDHFLALIEAASVGASLIHIRAASVKGRRPSDVYKGHAPKRRGSEPVAVSSAPTLDSPAEVLRLRAALDEIAALAGDASSGALPDRPVSNTSAQKTHHGGVAD